MKNGVVPPPEVRRLFSFIDLKCYVEEPPRPLGLSLTLTHLNPVLVNRLPQHKALVLENREPCLPVQKNNQLIPDDGLNIVRWIDLEKYSSTPSRCRHRSPSSLTTSTRCWPACRPSWPRSSTRGT
jgi:hypothetical protein